MEPIDLDRVDLGMLEVLLQTRKITMERAIERYQETLQNYETLIARKEQHGRQETN